MDYCLQLKYYRRQCILLPLSGPNPLQIKFNSKMQDFKRGFGLGLQVEGRLNSLIFSIGFQMTKIWCFQMALNTREM